MKVGRLAGLPSRGPFSVPPQARASGNFPVQLVGRYCHCPVLQVGSLGAQQGHVTCLQSHSLSRAHPSLCCPRPWGVFALCQVDRADVWDAGHYTCEALNQAGRSEKHYDLNVWGEGLPGWAGGGGCCLDCAPGHSPPPACPRVAHPLPISAPPPLTLSLL